jgi:hypothetical protein
MLKTRFVGPVFGAAAIVIILGTAAGAATGVMCHPNHGGNNWCATSPIDCIQRDGHQIAGEPPCTVK